MLICQKSFELCDAVDRESNEKSFVMLVGNN